MKLYSVHGYDSFVKEEETGYLQMDKIMKRLFMLDNKRPVIDFLNAIYKDNISYSAKLSYGNKEINNISGELHKYISFYADMYIKVEDNENIYEYAIEFQTVYEQDMSIRIFRYSFEKAARNIIKLKLKNYMEITLPEPYLIVLEEEKDLRDNITLRINVPKGESIDYNIKVLRYWKYDLNKLYSKNMYLLYPLQLFKLRKEMEKMSKRNYAYEQNKKDMSAVYNKLKDTVNKTLIFIDMAYNDGKINISDYNEMNVIIENLNSYFVQMYGKYGNIEEEIVNMVKSFYDPKVEEKGIEKGIEKGMEKGKKI
ncbi:MAG: hypothetical protein LIR50_03125, partial [Bacillota bacterium]|nr:hypothetical protein [Bacillota bacterium]